MDHHQLMARREYDRLRVRLFLSAKCETGNPEHETLLADLIAAFRQWCEEEHCNAHPFNGTMFGREIHKFGIWRSKNHYKGVRLKELPTWQNDLLKRSQPNEQPQDASM